MELARRLRLPEHPAKPDSAPRYLRHGWVTIAFLGLLTGAVVWPSSSSAHIPITTKIMFDKEVVRILQRNCLGCHHPGGISFSLVKYDDARPWAKDIEYEMLRGLMPPWRAVNGYGEFTNAPQMTERDIEVLVNWVENGVPEGNSKDLPKEPLYSDSWRLGRPDLILKPDAAAELAADANEYRTFTFTPTLHEGTWIRALDLKPGDGSVVHCATIYIERPRSPGQLEFVDYWMPGQKATAWPRDTGVAWPVGSRIVVKIHYRGTGSAAKDLSELGLYLTREPPLASLLEAAMTAPKVPVMTVAALSGLERVTATYSVTADSRLVGLRPAVDPRIVSLQATAYSPDGGEQVLLWTRGCDSDWAPAYYLRRPLNLVKGTQVEAVAYIDNSPPNRGSGNFPPSGLLREPTDPAGLCKLILTGSGNTIN